MLRALAETVEHVKAGFPVPKDDRITVEDWQEFVLVQANFGLLTNRAFAQLLAQLLSEKVGFAVVVQHDAYRIFVQTMGAADSDQIIALIDEMKAMSEQTITETLTRATVKTGLFKRRMIHVARRFGALEKWADFSSVSLQRLVASFEATPIYDEALKEVFTKDLDLKTLVHVLERIRQGQISIQRIVTGGVATPIARLGIERVSMKTDLIPPERMRAVLVESAKVRLLSEAATLVCTNCWSYSEMLRINNLPDHPKCPRCASTAIGLLKVDEEKVIPIVEKKGEKLTQSEEKLQKQALATARLIAKYGKTAAVALSARRVQPADLLELLQKEPRLNDRFYELVLEAERKAMGKRFW